MSIKKTLIYWRDIPSQVVLQRGRTREKAMLSSRFQEAIDRAAMRAGKGSSDAYMSEWDRKVSRVESDEALSDLAQAEAAMLEAAFTDDDLTALIRAHGRAGED